MYGDDIDRQSGEGVVVDDAFIAVETESSLWKSLQLFPFLFGVFCPFLLLLEPREGVGEKKLFLRLLLWKGVREEKPWAEEDGVGSDGFVAVNVNLGVRIDTKPLLGAQTGVGEEKDWADNKTAAGLEVVVVDPVVVMAFESKSAKNRHRARFSDVSLLCSGSHLLSFVACAGDGEVMGWGHGDGREEQIDIT